MKIYYQQLKNVIFAYIGLPVVLFLALYCKSLIGLILGIFSVTAYFFATRKNKCSDDCIIIPKKLLIALAFIVIFWCYLGGQGGLYYQSSDWNMRNTLFRDIINLDWPVIYEQYGKALVYYIAYWLAPALIGKGTLLLTGNENTAFFTGNIALWLWTAIGVFLVVLMFIYLTKPKTNRAVMFCMAFLVLFSGMDIIGVIYKVVFRGQAFPNFHIEWWLDELQFSSITTCLFWVFNQAVIPWLVTLCLMKEKSVKNYVYMGVCAFASGPIPFMGVLVYMLGNAVVMFYRAVHTKSIRKFLCDAFSVQNILFLSGIPPFILYYISNLALNTGAHGSVLEGGIPLGFMILKPITLGELARYALFLIVEIGIYLIILVKDNKKDPLYIITCISVVLAPFFAIGTAYDFVMRFSIPAVMMTAVFVAKYILEHKNDRKLRARRVYIILCICLALGAITPVTEFTRGYYEVLQSGKVNLVCDHSYTLNSDRGKSDPNFVSYDYESSLFFKYFVD